MPLWPRMMLPASCWMHLLRMMLPVHPGRRYSSVLESTLGHFFYHYTTGYLKTPYVIIRKNNTTGYLKTHYVIIRKNNIISTLYKIHFLYNYTTGYLKTNYVKLPFNGLIIHLKNNIISWLIPAM